jgi:small-conductance mechanosensitive channel
MVSQGLMFALRSVSYLDPWRSHLEKASIAFGIIVVTYGLAITGRLLFGWYLRRKKVRQSLTHLVQRVTIIVAYIIGLLVLLDYLGVSISPILAGLGVGGLAVALALQPTFSNFFAGTQIVFDKMVKVGDYIQLDSGETGFIVEVGWRSTRVSTTFNNLMIIPNSRLVDSIVTNYHGPTMDMAVMVESGVSYNSDLSQVERVALEVAQQVIDDLPEASKNREPWFAFETFGDSNINFWVWLYANDRVGSFRVKSEVIKRLHARFEKEGITINYPVRLLTYEEENSEGPPFKPGTSNSDNPDETN